MIKFFTCIKNTVEFVWRNKINTKCLPGTQEKWNYDKFPIFSHFVLSCLYFKAIDKYLFRRFLKKSYILIFVSYFLNFLCKV